MPGPSVGISVIVFDVEFRLPGVITVTRDVNSGIRVRSPEAGTVLEAGLSLHRRGTLDDGLARHDGILSPIEGQSRHVSSRVSIGYLELKEVAGSHTSVDSVVYLTPVTPISTVREHDAADVATLYEMEGLERCRRPDSDESIITLDEQGISIVV